jgi:hypothetical protein
VNPILVITSPHGEEWRCQAVTARGRRCTKAAALEGEHPLRKVKMALCLQHGAIAQRADTTLRVNAAAGYATQVVPVYGGTLDGIEGGLAVPYNLRIGDQWVVDITGGQLEKYELRLATHPEPLEQNLKLVYLGPASPSAPGAPEQSDMPRQP